jgi:hypothetical protein
MNTSKQYLANCTRPSLIIKLRDALEYWKDQIAQANDRAEGLKAQKAEYKRRFNRIEAELLALERKHGTRM